MGSGLAGFLAALVAPFARRAMTALGFSLVTFVGVREALDFAFTNAQSSLAGLPGDAIALISMAGFPSALGIISGAVIARLSMIQLKRFIPG